MEHAWPWPWLVHMETIIRSNYLTLSNLSSIMQHIKGEIPLANILRPSRAKQWEKLERSPLVILKKKVCNLSTEIKPNICADRSAMNYWGDSRRKKEKITRAFLLHALMIYFWKLAPHFGTALSGLFLSRKRSKNTSYRNNRQREEVNVKRSHKITIRSTDCCCTNGFSHYDQAAVRCFYFHWLQMAQLSHIPWPADLKNSLNFIYRRLHFTLTHRCSHESENSNGELRESETSLMFIT